MTFVSPPSVWIVNASPFIGLAKAGYLGVLAAPGRTVLMPDAVAREVAMGPPNDPAVTALMPSALVTAGISVLPPSPADPRITAYALDSGETAVLTEALARPGSAAVIDETRGRAAAVALGVPVTGSLGILVLARREARIAALAPAIRSLKAVGLYLPGEAYLRNLLAGVGETWP